MISGIAISGTLMKTYQTQGSVNSAENQRCISRTSSLRRIERSKDCQRQKMMGMDLFPTYRSEVYDPGDLRASKEEDHFSFPFEYLLIR